MASESFAQGRITGEPGRRFQLRGGGVPIGDIPNLPKPDLTMPTAQYPSIPAIRHQEMTVGGQDWGRRAAQLQQDELPGSFAHAQARMTAAAGKGEAAMGEAISKGSAVLAAGLGNLAEGLNRYQKKLEHETMKSVGAKEDNAYQVARAKFTERVAKESIQPADYEKQFWSNEGKEYLQYVDSIKPNRGMFSSIQATDDLEAKVASRQAGFYAYTKGEEAKKIHESNVSAHDFRYDNAIREGRFDDANMAIYEAGAAGLLNKGQMDAKYVEVRTLKNKKTAETMKVTYPEGLVEETEKIANAKDDAAALKASDILPGVDKVQAKVWHDEAEKAIVERDHNSSAELLKQASAANWTEAQIREKAKDLKLKDKTLIDKTVDAVKNARPYDDGKIGDIYAALNDPKFSFDGDPKEAAKNYRLIEQKILDTADPRSRDEILMPELKKRWAERGKPTTLQQEEVKSSTQMVTDTFSNELERAKEEGEKTGDKSKLFDVSQRRLKAYQEIERYHKEHPDFDPGKLHEHMQNYLQPGLQKSSKDAVNAQTTPTATAQRPKLVPYGEKSLPSAPAEGSDEWIAKKVEEGQTKKGEVKTPYTMGTPQQGPAAPEPIGAGGAPTPYVPPIPTAAPGSSGAPTPMNPAIQKLEDPYARLGATQLEPGKLLRGMGVDTETEPGAKWAIPIHGYTPSPTPVTGVKIAPGAAKPVAQGTKLTINATAYVPGLEGRTGPGKEGKNEVAYRRGPAYTFEQYQSGDVPWVSVAADPESSLQGKFLKNDAYPGVLFKVEDTGRAFKGKGDTRIDIAFSDPSKADSFVAAGNDYQVVDEAQATQIAGGPRGGSPSVTARTTTTAGPLEIASAVTADHPAMARHRDTSQIKKIVIHGDVSTNVPNLIAYAKKSDRGYHYYIGLDGKVTQVVPDDRKAYHIQGANTDSIGIILVGADNGRMPTAEQEAAAKTLIAQLSAKYGIDRQDVKGHGERQPGHRHELEGGYVARDWREGKA